MSSTTQREVTVVICDDDALACHALKLLLQDADIAVLCACTTAEECLRSVEVTPPQVAVIDLQLGSDPQSGIGLIKRIREASPTTLCLVLTATDPRGRLLPAAFVAGAHGFHRKGYVSGPELAGIVKRMAAGEWEIDHELAMALAATLEMQRSRPDDGPPSVCLMSAELKVLQMVAAGSSTQTIARALDVPSHVVRSHMRNITDKYHRAGSTAMQLCW